jgi:hypothetical protein
MSRVQVSVRYDDREESRREQLLALSTLRRGMERRSPRCGAQRSWPVAVILSEVARTLRELIAALDARVPRVENAGEAAIARDAAALRDKAVNRLAEIAEQTTSAAGVPPDRVS